MSGKAAHSWISDPDGVTKTCRKCGCVCKRRGKTWCHDGVRYTKDGGTTWTRYEWEGCRPKEPQL